MLTQGEMAFFSLAARTRLRDRTPGDGRSGRSQTRMPPFKATRAGIEELKARADEALAQELHAIAEAAGRDDAQAVSLRLKRRNVLDELVNSNPLFCPVGQTAEVRTSRMRGESIAYILRRRQEEAGTAPFG